MLQNRRHLQSDRLAQELPFFTNMVPFPGSDLARIVDETLFRHIVQLEIIKAQRLHYYVSIVCLSIDSPHAEIDDSLMSRLAEGFLDRIRATDVVVPRPASSWTLLLVDAQPRALPSIVHRITEHFGRLRWSAGGASYPGTAFGAEDLLRRAFDLAAQAQEEGGHQLYLPS